MAPDAPAAGLTIRLLGEPEVTLDGREVSFERRGSIALLAYLATVPGVHPRANLEQLLRGNRSESQARKLLSNILVDLRHEVGPYVAAVRDGFVFERSRPHVVDQQEFLGVVRTPRERCEPDVLPRLLRLYRGDFLAGFSLPGAHEFEAWVLAERRHLNRLFVGILRATMTDDTARGDVAAAALAARRLLEDEPWLDEAHQSLMRYLAHAGLRGAAIAQYHRCRRVLRDELGIGPQPATQALFERVRTPVAAPRHNLPRPLTPLVGRASEAGTLARALVDAPAKLVTLTGPAGIGKSRLALDVAWRLVEPSSTLADQPFQDGVFLVRLPASASPARVVDSVWAQCARLLELSPALPAAELRQAVLTGLARRARLLVLDGADGLREQASALAALLADAPATTVLATARHPLQLVGEQTHEVVGLAVPRSVAELEDAPASALFLREATRANGGFRLASEHDRRALVAVCQSVGGSPLALRRAAGWAAVLGCATLATAAANGFDVVGEPALSVGSVGPSPERAEAIRLDRSANLRRYVRLATAPEVVESTIR
jgi:DNA-binding SARP family transcriptional activator